MPITRKQNSALGRKIVPAGCRTPVSSSATSKGSVKVWSSSLCAATGSHHLRTLSTTQARLVAPGTVLAPSTTFGWSRQLSR